MKIHPTALVDPKAELGAECVVGPFCIVGPKVKLGANSILHSNVVLEGRTTVGARTVIYPFSYIGAVPADLKYKGEDTELVIGEDCSIRENVSIHLGTAFGGGITRIGNKCLIMAYTHLGHDCIIGNEVILTNSCQLAGHVTVEDFAIIGGMTGISQFVRVGAHAYIGGASGVSKDVAPYCIGLGPAGTFEIKGVNIVGLKRRQFGQERISQVMEAHKIFFREGLEKATAVAKIEEKFAGNADIDYFLNFIKSSESGVHR